MSVCPICGNVMCVDYPLLHLMPFSSYELCLKGHGNKIHYVRYFDDCNHLIFEVKIDHTRKYGLVNNTKQNKFIICKFNNNVKHVSHLIDKNRYSKYFEVSKLLYENNDIVETFSTLDLFS